MKLPALYSLLALLVIPAFAQGPPDSRGPGRGGPGGPGRGGPGGPQETRKLLEQFDKNKDGTLDASERADARAFLKENPTPSRWGRGGGRRGRGGPGSPDGHADQSQDSNTAIQGTKIAKEDVKPIPDADLYAPEVLRTVFLDFENDDWESELEDFHNTDVLVPATLTVDGKNYPGVGVHFRGASSYGMVPTGKKRSFSISVNHTVKGQKVAGYGKLKLNNNAGDASFLSASLYSQIARKYIPAPKVNLVRVVINGEDWGVYTNQQHFNKDFVRENFPTSKGARWKVPGSPNGRGGLEYLGDDPAAYQRIYTMKSGSEDDQKALIQLCKTLSETPLEELEKALESQLNIEGALWFLALDIALNNSDGYWTRASDYTLYRDHEGRFHIIPHDMNESFRQAGRGRRGDSDQGSSGLDLDPLIGMNDTSKPLRSRLLAVPSLRASYLEKVRQIAEQDLDWKNLGPIIAAQKELISEAVAADVRKLGTTEQFEWMTSDDSAAPAPQGMGRMGMHLRTFADGRRAYLLSWAKNQEKDQ